MLPGVMLLRISPSSPACLKTLSLEAQLSLSAVNKLPALDQHPFSAHSRNVASPAALMNAGSHAWEYVHFT